LCNSCDDVVEKIFTLTGKQVKFYKGDLRNKEDIEKVFRENTLDGVIHFA
jgi:UDP-glucose 4-epimerase